MNNFDQLVTARFQELPIWYQEFVESDFAAQAAQVLAQDFNLSENQRVVIENGFVLYLLLVLEKQDLIEYLTQRGNILVETAFQLATIFIASLPEYFSEDVEIEASNELEEPSDLTLEIAETERAIDSLKGLRTMARDMRAVDSNDEPIHSSNQADILNASPNEPPPAPRWGSE